MFLFNILVCGPATRNRFQSLFQVMNAGRKGSENKLTLQGPVRLHSLQNGGRRVPCAVHGEGAKSWLHMVTCIQYEPKLVPGSSGGLQKRSQQPDIPWRGERTAGLKCHVCHVETQSWDFPAAAQGCGGVAH